MSQVTSLQACQLVAPNKLPERLLTSGIIKREGKLNLAEDIALVYLFEVNQPWFPSSKLFPSLIELLETAHPSLKVGDDLDSQFEFLLKTINQQLNQISESGETDWIGNFNAIVLLIAGNEIFFSQTGFCPTYLLQNNKIRQITDPNDQDKETHPLKTFSNLASGTIQENDSLLIANTELYREISLDALRRIMNSCTPYLSCRTIGKELKKEKNSSITAILLNMSEPKIVEPEKVYLEDIMQSPLRKLHKTLVPIAKKTIDATKRAGKATHGFMTNTIAPATSNALKATKNGLVKGASKIAGAGSKISGLKSKPKVDFPIVEIILPTSKLLAAKEAEIKAQEQAAAQVTEQIIEPIKNDQVIEPIIDNTENLTLKTVNNDSIREDLGTWYSIALGKMKRFFQLTHQKNIIAIGNLKLWFRSSKNKKISAAVLAIAIIGVTTCVIVNKCRPKATTVSNNQNNQIIQEVQADKEKIATAIELKQEVEASRLILGAQEKLNGLTNLTDADKNTVNQLKYEIDQTSDPLTKTTRISPTESYSFSKAGDNLLLALPYFYTFNGSALFRTGKGDLADAQEVTNLSSKDDSIIDFTRSIEEDNTIGYALTKQNKVYRISQINGSTTLTQIKPETDDFSVGDKISTYNGNIYILNGKSGLLWKYANTGTVYQKGVSIIDLNKYNIRDSISFDIDGSFYLLMQDGTIQKFTSGKQDTFNLSGIPELSKTLIKPVQIISNAQSDSIYLLDSGATNGPFSTARVIEYNKSGLFVGQYKFPQNFLRVTSIDVDQKLKKMWVLNGNEVSEFDI